MDHHLGNNDNNSSDGPIIAPPPQRVVLLLDLDCFYAQCERIRLGLPGHCCLALLQWNSCLAVSYPARAFGIKRGDGFEEVHQKSQGKCMAVHVPILEAPDATNNNNNHDNKHDNNETSYFDGNYESVYRLPPEEQQRQRARDIGRRRYSTEGKACLERYRTASRKIFEVVMECLGMTNNINNTKGKPRPTGGVILEKASIDEFFLDVTAVCANLDHPIWESIQNYFDRSLNEKSTTTLASDHKSVVVGLQQEGKDDNQQHQQQQQQQQQQPGPHSPENKALERGCQLAHYIRTYVFQTLGFTLSAGISTNKTVAKLAASYGKPNGQAVVYPYLVTKVLQDTQVSKVRNFGGKLGKAVLELLPTDVPQTMGSVAKYLSLPQLQERFQQQPQQGRGADSNTGASTAKWVFEACRGYDSEPVEAKNTGNVVKSITAFKSLPRSLDADVEDPAFLQWLALLVKEVASRVQTDAQRNLRWPRNCCIQYGLEGHVTSAGRLDMKSFRIPFPPKRLSLQERITQLMEVIPAKIILREGGEGKSTSISNGGLTHRKRIKPVRIGVCATDLIEEASKHGNITNFFSAKPSAKVSDKEPTSKSPKEEPPTSGLQTKNYTQHNQTHPESSAPSVAVAVAAHPTNSEETDHDKDARYARQLQGAFDKEQRTLSQLDNIGVSSLHNTSTKGSPEQPSKGSLEATGACASASLKGEDEDLAVAKKLQASYDRENSILGSWESRRQQCTSSRGRRGQPATKKAKTRKMSAFFGKAG